MGLISIVLEVFMLTGLVGAFFYIARELFKPQCAELVIESCTTSSHSVLVILLICLFIVIFGVTFKKVRSLSRT